MNHPGPRINGQSGSIPRALQDGMEGRDWTVMVSALLALQPMPPTPRGAEHSLGPPCYTPTGGVTCD